MKGSFGAIPDLNWEEIKLENRIQETQRSRNLRVLKKNVYISCEGDTEEAYLLGLKKQFSSKANIKISNSKKQQLRM